jgi:hypothetical protein
MNTQGGSRLRQATAVRGKTEIGSQPHAWGRNAAISSVATAIVLRDVR